MNVRGMCRGTCEECALGGAPVTCMRICMRFFHWLMLSRSRPRRQPAVSSTAVSSYIKGTCHLTTPRFIIASIWTHDRRWIRGLIRTVLNTSEYRDRCYHNNGLRDIEIAIIAVVTFNENGRSHHKYETEQIKRTSLVPSRLILLCHFCDCSNWTSDR